MADSRVELQEVQILFPGYDIIDRYDGGSQAAVYMARQLTTNRTVAIKILTQGLLVRESYRQRFFNEIDMVSQLDHENIVTLYDFGEAAGHPYYVMQHVLGMPITDHAFLHGFNVRQCVELFLRVCDAISYAHTMGIIHRDIKPSNVIVNEQGRPYVLDFGLGKFLSDHERKTHLFETQPFQIVGTVPYMSPEQASGGILDSRSDVYSLAVLLYEMITDDLPYALTGSKEQGLHAVIHEEPTPLRPRLASDDRCTPHEVTRDLQAIFSKALRKAPADRYQTTLDLAQDLRSFLSGDTVQARAGSTTYLLRKSLSKNRKLCVVAAASLVAVTALLFWAAEMRGAYRTALTMNGYLKLGSTQRDLDRVDSAIQLFEAAIELGEHGSAPADHAVRRLLFDGHQRLAEALLGEGDKDKAEHHCHRALQLATDLADANQGDPSFRRIHAAAHRLMGRISTDRGALVKAAESLEHCASIRQSLLAEDPDNEGYLQEMLSVRALQGECYRRLKDYESATFFQDEELSLALTMYARESSADSAVHVAYARLHQAAWYMHQRAPATDACALEELHEASRLLAEHDISQVRPRDARILQDAIDRNSAIIQARASQTN